MTSPRYLATISGVRNSTRDHVVSWNQRKRNVRVGNKIYFSVSMTFETDRRDPCEYRLLYYFLLSVFFSFSTHLFRVFSVSSCCKSLPRTRTVLWRRWRTTARQRHPPWWPYVSPWPVRGIWFLRCFRNSLKSTRPLGNNRYDLQPDFLLKRKFNCFDIRIFSLEK